jgi:hypothetical protein
MVFDLVKCASWQRRKAWHLRLCLDLTEGKIAAIPLLAAQR